MRTRLRRPQPLLVCVLALGLVLLVGGVMESLHAQAPTVVRYWLWLDDPTEPMFDQLVKEFNAIHATIRVEYQHVSLTDYHDKLVTALAGCSGPHAGRFKDWWLGEFVKLNALEPLPTYIAKWPGRADVIENLWNTGKITEAGAAYMMLHRFITFYLYYRRDWFADAGLSGPRRRSTTSWRPPRSSRTPPRTSTASACGAAPAGRIGGWPSWWWAARASWTRRGRSLSIMPRV